MDQTFDYVVTVCDEARQVCPVFPGVHESLHWGYEDPAEAVGSEDERLAVFRRVFIQIGERVRQFATATTRAARQARRPA
jgi:arsenate reductase